MALDRRRHVTSEWLQAVVVVGILTMAAFTTGVVMFFKVPTENAQLVGQIQGSLWLAVGGICQFFFGRNKGSDQKDAALATAVQVAQTAQQQPAATEPAGTVIPVAAGDSVTVEGKGDAD